MKILQLTVHFRPNVGGVETHLDDLCEALIKRGFNVKVLTYRPLHTKAAWKLYEKNDGLEIFRIPWVPDLFYKLINYPLLEFIYLLPGLFLITPFILLTDNFDVIHAHGIVAGFVATFWGKIFGKRVIVSTHSLYNFPKKGLYREFVRWIFNNTKQVLTLSKQAAEEIKSLKILAKVDNFTYWIDLNKFIHIDNAKSQLGWVNKFVVLFVGRLIAEKGILILLESAKTWDNQIDLMIAGSGPLHNEIEATSKRFRNIRTIGIIDQNKLPTFYSASDILIVPSTSEEGFGRVILESLACGTPVIGSKKGAIPEAMDDSVGKLIDVNEKNIKEAVEYFYHHKSLLKKKSSNCRKLAERRYSEVNVEKIIKAYK